MAVPKNRRTMAIIAMGLGVSFAFLGFLVLFLVVGLYLSDSGPGAETYVRLLRLVFAPVLVAVGAGFIYLSRRLFPDFWRG